MQWPLAVLALVAAPVLMGAARVSSTLEGFVVYVVDGDTVHVRINDRVEKVRYLGINAPEIPHPHRGGPPPRPRAHGSFPRTAAAGDAAKRINLDLAGGQHVRLELDHQHRDEHGRLLAYVWAGETMLNAEMVKRGYAEVMSIPPDLRYRALLTRLQNEARQAGRGLWVGSSRVERSPPPPRSVR
ncbi:MAG TPA: thermonuclease family protein [Methylomirabilota bacterium]|nr:thermonuclease family protein [Methylomirabilota bacterium]